MKRTYKVRFGPSTNLTVLDHKSLALVKNPEKTHNTKSKTGCRECRRRRVKCDERFPICLRCQRAGTACRVEPPLRKWQLELPGITIRRAPDLLSMFGQHIDGRLLQHWLEKTSQMMVLNPDLNPLSYPILQLLGQSPWLASVLQSISSAYEKDFKSSALTECLRQRQQALTLFRREVTSLTNPLASTLLGIFLLGVSSCWIYGTMGLFGKEHLFGGRVVLDMMLSQEYHNGDSLRDFAIGTYIYWDMSCSLIVDPAEQTPLDTPDIISSVKRIGDSYHPMSGHAIGLFYLLALLGRHCRLVIDSGICDAALEENLEERLMAWQSAPAAGEELLMLGEAFRIHGLIFLYRVCGLWRYGDMDCAAYEHTEDTIHQLALDGLKALMCTPIDSSHVSMQPIPLLTIGSELRIEDKPGRGEVLMRLKALHSINRTPVNLWAIELLHEHWSLRDEGICESYVALMLRKGWRLTMG